MAAKLRAHPLVFDPLGARGFPRGYGGRLDGEVFRKATSPGPQRRRARAGRFFWRLYFDSSRYLKAMSLGEADRRDGIAAPLAKRVPVFASREGRSGA